MATILGALTANAQLLNPQTYWGICGASAAVPLDNEQFVVADDEGTALRVYKRGQPDAVRVVEIAKFLGIKKKGEADLEGAARVGDRIYWITSHGRTKDGKEAPDRQKFFATTIIGKPASLIEPVGQTYTTLLSDIFAETRFSRFGFREASLLAPKERGGLNIEGLCARADGSLLIAFRNPIPGGKALLLPLLNPDKVIEGEKPKFGDVIELALQSNGFRDLVPVGDRFMIIAGPRSGGKESRLFLWNGRDANPQPVVGTDFEKLNPEAIFRFPNDAAGVFQVLSDDGGKKTGGKECKDLRPAERHFRGGEVHINLPQ